MADIRDTQASGEDAALETELEGEEKHLKAERDADHYLGEHPDGVGPTLGQDLLRPNPGHDIDVDDEDYDPPT